VIAAAQQLATALKGNIPAGNETAEALTTVSRLFAKLLRQNLMQRQQKNSATNSELIQQEETHQTAVSAPLLNSFFSKEFDYMYTE
jgi:hypothetical protein